MAPAHAQKVVCRGCSGQHGTAAQGQELVSQCSLGLSSGGGDLKADFGICNGLPGHTCEGRMRVDVSRETHTGGVLIGRALVHLQGGRTASALSSRMCL